MARSFTPRINRHVTVRRADGRPRSLTITAVTDLDTINGRVGHAGETYTALIKIGDNVVGPGWQNTRNDEVKVSDSLYPSAGLLPATNLYPGA